jgi:dihydrofolate reductase
MNNASKISLIYARSLNGVIGKNNDLPGWKIPGDLKRFKALTAHGVVVMGYKTWLSLPEHTRPLKDRLNIVITTRLGLESDESEGLYFVNSIAEAKERVGQLLAREELPVWIIGGATIYKAFEPLATHIYETVLMAHVDGDVGYQHQTLFGQVLESEEVVSGEYGGRTHNVHHRVWRTKKVPV